MKNKYKILLVIIGIILIGSILLGTSYALWIYTAVQDGSNVVNSDCFDLSFQGSNDINLESTLPLSEYRGQNLEPYTFTIKNICNHSASYEVNMETLNTSTMDLNAIRYKLNTNGSKILGQAKEVASSNYVNNDVKQSNNIAKGILKSDEEITFNLRIWIDGSSTVEQSANKTYESKIVVIASLVKENVFSGAKLVSGPIFNKAIKELAGDSYSESEIESLKSIMNNSNDLSELESGDEWLLAMAFRKMYDEDSSLLFVFQDNTIEGIVKSNELPNSDVKTAVVSTPDSAYEIKAWLDNRTIYLYSESEKLYMNENSSGMFMLLNALSSIDLSIFDTSLVNDFSFLFALDIELMNLDLSTFNTENATEMMGMFMNMIMLKQLNLESFNTSNVINMSGMFYSLNKRMFTTIEVKDFDVSNVSESKHMFEDCKALVGGAGTTYDASHVDIEYARIDDPTNSKPGYFTLKTN